MRKKEAVGSKGLKFESFIINKLNEISKLVQLKPTKGSHKWDAYTDKGVPVSIKNVRRNGSNDINLADIFRQSKIETSEFYLIIGFWGDKDNNDKTNLQDLYILKINSERWMSMFDESMLNGYKRMLKGFEGYFIGQSNSPKKWLDLVKRANKMWSEKTPNIIRPRPKWGPSNSTRRIQCSINQKDFFDRFMTDKEMIISKRVIPMKSIVDEYREYLNLSSESDETIEINEKITTDEVEYKDRTERKTTVERNIKVNKKKKTFAQLKKERDDEVAKIWLAQLERLRKIGEENRSLREKQERENGK